MQCTAMRTKKIKLNFQNFFKIKMSKMKEEYVLPGGDDPLVQ